MEWSVGTRVFGFLHILMEGEVMVVEKFVRRLACTLCSFKPNSNPGTRPRIMRLCYAKSLLICYLTGLRDQHMRDERLLRCLVLLCTIGLCPAALQPKIMLSHRPLSYNSEEQRCERNKVTCILFCTVNCDAILAEKSLESRL